MHKRVVLVVSALLFALLAAATWLVTDMHDRAFPESLDVAAGVSLDFGSSQVTDEEAFATLGQYSDRLGMGLIKVAPDLTGDQQGQVFVSVGTRHDLPDSVERFGNQPDAIVRDNSALENSYASGQYLVTGESSGVAELQAWLQQAGVTSEWQADDLGGTLESVLRLDSLALSLLATAVLLMSLVLYWLAVKARGRALRVLCGAPAWRVQAEDLGGFFLPLLASATVVCAAAAGYVAAMHGIDFVGYYLSTLALFVVIVLVATLIGAVAMSVISAPSASMFATRRPAVSSIRRVSVVAKVVTFLVVLAAVAPAYHALADSRTVAAQQAKWRSLSDQVALSFPYVSESRFVELMPTVGAVVADAERSGAVALSYTWTADNLADVDLGPTGHISFVNQRWIDLMLAPTGTAASVSGEYGDLPEEFQAYLSETLPLWSREESGTTTFRENVTVLQLSDAGGVPLARAGGGDLLFPETATLIVVPGPYEQFNDSFLVSAASSGNLVFSGLGETEDRLAGHGLAGTLDLKLVAEEGVLFAQVAEYSAWLKGVSLVALIVALVMSALIAAFIASILNVRRDFPLRLAGRGWWEVLSTRLLRETAIGLVLVGVAVLLTRGTDAPLVLAVGLAALLVAPLAHVTTARWAFANARTRRL